MCPCKFSVKSDTYIFDCRSSLKLVIVLNFIASHLVGHIFIFHLIVLFDILSMAIWGNLVLRFSFVQWESIAVSSAEINISLLVLLLGISAV